MAILIVPLTRVEYARAGKAGWDRRRSGGKNCEVDLNGGLYATAHVRIPIEEYGAQWDSLVGDWLPGSGYQPDQRPAMEFYLNNLGTNPEGRYHLEICLPVRPL